MGKKKVRTFRIVIYDSTGLLCAEKSIVLHKKYEAIELLPTTADGKTGPRFGVMRPFIN